jgi:A/G-specific adenine glycosylase
MNETLLTQSLLDWYDRVRRELPWRENQDPYRIWVSEIMLQQTRVETVIPYYHRFLERFPDIYALAQASEEDLMSVWQGLGYYSRARNLQQGVREVVARYGGEVPDSHAAIVALPGIGAYTAGAILSIAHNKAEPAVDGNVFRVISRLLKIEEPIEQPSTKRRVEGAVRSMMAAIPRYGDITQALMELGAIVCTPRNPRCRECPWEAFCIAYANEVQGDLPRKKVPDPVKIVPVYTGILIDAERVLAVKRPPQGLLAGMWEFPSVETVEAAGAQDKLAERFRELGCEVEVEVEWFTLKHTFSHREWQMRFFLCQGMQRLEPSFSGGEWMDCERVQTAIWAGPHRKAAARVVKKIGELSQKKGS